MQIIHPSSLDHKRVQEEGREASFAGRPRKKKKGREKKRAAHIT